MVTVMKIIDLSHTIAKTTPVFPGSEKPHLTTVASYEKTVIANHSFVFTRM